MGQDSLRLHLKDQLESGQKKDPQYSLRSLAKGLGVPAGNLSLFLAGKRNFSKSTLIQIVERLTSDPEERKELLSQMETQETPPARPAQEADRLTEEEFLQLEDWHYFAVRTALSLSTNQSDPSWIAEKLGISNAEAEKVLKVLFRLKLIKLSPDGKIVRTKKHLLTPDSIQKEPRIDAHKKKIHAQHIQRALQALEVDPSRRDITWVNIPTNPKKIDRARELIRKFQDDMLDLLEDEESSELYRLTIQLAPMS